MIIGCLFSWYTLTTHNCNPITSKASIIKTILLKVTLYLQIMVFKVFFTDLMVKDVWSGCRNNDKEKEWVRSIPCDSVI